MKVTVTTMSEGHEYANDQDPGKLSGQGLARVILLEGFCCKSITGATIFIPPHNIATIRVEDQGQS